MKNCFPRIQDVVPVYAVISCMIYGWTFVLFFWKLPSWLHFMILSQVFGAFSYGILTNLIESLIVIGGLLGLCALLPSRYLRDTFIDRGSTITIIALGSVMLYQYQFRAVRFRFRERYPPLVFCDCFCNSAVCFSNGKDQVLKVGDHEYF